MPSTPHNSQDIASHGMISIENHKENFPGTVALWKLRIAFNGQTPVTVVRLVLNAAKSCDACFFGTT
jgi:hypothetical protein